MADASLMPLRERVSQAVAQGKTVEETVALCEEMRFWSEKREFLNMIQRTNVEHVYLELGGDADPAEVGWEAWWWKE